MKLTIHLFYGQCIILWNQYYFTNTNPLVGRNVRPATHNEYPGVVSIQLVTDANSPIIDHICTGTLISKEDVLTSEHCFQGIEKFRGFKVSLGTPDLLYNIFYYPAWWLSYIKWATNRNIQIQFQMDDIAIIRLTKSVDNTINIATAVYPPKSSLYGDEVFVASWGKFPNGTTNKIMQTVNLTVLTDTECNQILTTLLNKATVIGETFLCTVSRPSFALLTKGDSGGPLFHEDTLVAINKATCPLIPNVNQAEKVNIHVTLRYYKAFILYILFHM